MLSFELLLLYRMPLLTFGGGDGGCCAAIIALFFLFYSFNRLVCAWGPRPHLRDNNSRNAVGNCVDTVGDVFKCNVMYVRSPCPQRCLSLCHLPFIYDRICFAIYLFWSIGILWLHNFYCLNHKTAFYCNFC